MAPSSNRLGMMAVTLAHITVDMHTGSLVVLLPLLLTSFDLGYTSAAFIITANNLVIAAAQPLFGTFGDRRSLPWLVPAGCLLTGAAMVSVLFVPSYALVLPVVMLSGVGSAAFHPEALARMRAISGRFAASSTSVFFAGGNIGFALGPTLATLLLGRFGRPGALALLVPTGLALAVLAGQWRNLAGEVRGGAKRKVPVEGGSRPVRGVVGLVALLMMLIVLRGTTLTGLQTFIPLYFQEQGTLPLERSALLVSLLLVSGVVGTLFGGVLADRIGRKALMIASMVLALLSITLFLQATGALRLLAVCVGGASLSAAWPIIVVMIQEAMPGNVGLASGLSLGTAYGATGLGVAALGGVADTFGLSVTMNVIALLPLGILALTLLLPRQVAGPSASLAGQ